MKLIVGLGNVGPKYEKTRHNIGFRVAEQLKNDLGISRQWHLHRSIAEEAELTHNAHREAMIVRPLTMMNLSGSVVGQLMRYYKLNPSDVWVIYDDFELPFGSLRTRNGGSSGGHNGVKSIIEEIGQDFGRLRIGVANDQLRNPIAPADFVLGRFTASEEQQLPQMIDTVSQVAQDYLGLGSIQDTTINLLDKTK